MDRVRIQAYLQAACSALNFDIGEIWCCNDTGRVAEKSELHFIQLYTSPAYCDYRTKLVTPSDDWESHKDVTKHRFSPLICEAVRDGGQIVWANTTVEEGLLGRSDLPLRTAVGAPVCNVGVDLCILVMFSPCILPNTPEAMEFLYTMAQAAADAMCGFLPASASSPVHHVLQMHSDAVCDHHRSREIIDALPKTISFQTWALQQVPYFAGHLRRGNGSLSLRGSFVGTRSTANLLGLGSMSDLAAAMGAHDDNGAQQAPGSPPHAGAGGGDFLEDIGFNIDEDFLIWSTVMDNHAPPTPPAAAAGDAGAAAAASSPLLSPSPLAAEAAPQPEAEAAAAAAASAAAGAAAVANGESSSTGAVMAEGSAPAAAAEALPLGTSAEGDSAAAPAASLAAVPGTVPPLPPRLLPNSPEADAASGLVLLPRRASINAGPASSLSSSSGGASSADGGGSSGSSCFFENPFLRARFEEFIRGFLAMSVFHAADCWLPNNADTLFLACSSVQDASLVKWTSYSASVTFVAGVGMPGRIFATQTSLWNTEYSSVDADCNPLCHIAEVLGVHTAFGVPIPVGNGKAGVIMFYSMDSLPPSELMLGFVERAVRLLLGDLPAAVPVPAALSQAVSLGRVAGAYNQHARWQEQAAQTRELPAPARAAILHRFSTGGSPTAAAATAAAAAAAAAAVGLTPGPMAPLSVADLHLQPAPGVSLGHAAVGAAAAPAAVSGFCVGGMPQIAAAGGAASLAMPVKQELLMMANGTSHSTAGLAPASEPPVGGYYHHHNGSNGNRSDELCSNASQHGGGGNDGGSSDDGHSGHSSSGGVCRMDGCDRATARRLPYCPAHAGSRHCAHPGCNKCAQGSTKFCIAHGGGRRCTFPGCNKGARDKFFCAAHGGGKRCVTDGCSKAAVGGSNLCTAHGGGRRCQFPQCTKSAQSSTNFCVRHGGGRKCQVLNCQKVARGRTRYCAAHGGGIRCRVEGCNKAAVGKQQMCRSHSGEPAPLPVGGVALAEKRALEELSDSDAPALKRAA